MNTSSGTSPPQEVRAVAEQLQSAAIHLLRRVRVRDAELGLSGPRLSVLSVVVGAGPRSIAELSSLEQVRSPTMTRLVDRLEDNGLVTREPNPSDARSVLVRATPMGKLALSRGRGARAADLEARIAELDPEEVAALGRGADLMERVAGTGPSNAGERPG